MPEKSLRILVIADDLPQCNSFLERLSQLNYLCTCAGSAAEARQFLEKETCEVVLLDARLPDASGIELLKEISRQYPNIVCIVQAADSNLSTAIESMKSGAADYLTRPLSAEIVNRAIKNALSRKAEAINANSPQPDPVISEIEAISLGVEARQEMLDIHSEKVIQQTLSIARQMGFSEEKLQVWTQYHLESHNQRIKQVSDSIAKLVNPD